MNSTNIIGTITKDIELKETQSGVKYVRFSIAVNRNYKNEDGEYDTDFFNVVAWRKTAEFISEYFGKGKRIGISGRLQQTSYDDNEGNHRTSVEIVANEVQLIEKKVKEEPSEVEETKEEDPMDDKVFAEFGDSLVTDDDFEPAF